MNRVVLAAVGVGMLVSAGSAQVLLPPPEKPEDFNKIPPPPDPNLVRLEAALKARNDQKMADQDRLLAKREVDKVRAQQKVTALYKREQLLEQLSHVQYESMVWRDENDKIVRLDQPPMIAAFNHNPLLDGATLEVVFGVIEDRRDRLQQRLAENAEVIKLIAGGEIERTSLADLNGIQRMRMLLKTLNLAEPIVQELGESGVIDQRQAFMNALIAKEYSTAVRAEIGAGVEGMKMQVLLVPMLRSQAEEALYVYEELVVASASSLENIAQRLELTESQQRVLGDTLAKLKVVTDKSGQLEAMNGFVSALEVSQIRAFLKLAAG